MLELRGRFRIFAFDGHASHHSCQQDGRIASYIFEDVMRKNFEHREGIKCRSGFD